MSAEHQSVISPLSYTIISDFFIDAHRPTLYDSNYFICATLTEPVLDTFCLQDVNNKHVSECGAVYF